MSEALPHYAAIQRHASEEADSLVQDALGVGVSRVEKDVVGASHAIYFLQLGDGREVVARVAIHPEHDVARDLWAMEVCRARGVPAPRVLAAHTDRAAGTPFAVLSRLPGNPAHARIQAGRMARCRGRCRSLCWNGCSHSSGVSATHWISLERSWYTATIG